MSILTQSYDFCYRVAQVMSDCSAAEHSEAVTYFLHLEGKEPRYHIWCQLCEDVGRTMHHLTTSDPRQAVALFTKMGLAVRPAVAAEWSELCCAVNCPSLMRAAISCKALSDDELYVLVTSLLVRDDTDNKGHDLTDALITLYGRDLTFSPIFETRQAETLELLFGRAWTALYGGHLLNNKQLVEYVLQQRPPFVGLNPEKKVVPGFPQDVLL